MRRIIDPERDDGFDLKTVRSSPQDLIELVGNKTGLNDTSVKTVWAVSDTLFCEVTTHTHTHECRAELKTPLFQV